MVSSPNRTEPWKNSTLATVPSLSEAVAPSAIVDPAMKVELLVGTVRLIVGGLEFAAEFAVEKWICVFEAGRHF